MPFTQLTLDAEIAKPNSFQPPATATRYLKNFHNKNIHQQISPNRLPLHTTCRFPHNSMRNRPSLLSEVSKSDTFIGNFAQSQSLKPRDQTSVFWHKSVSREGGRNFRSLRDASSEQLGKRSVQLLMRLSKGPDKTQYSKINRQKEGMMPKNANPSEAEIIKPLKEVEEFSSQKLIQKYRELIQKKDSRCKPLDMISRLYQIELLTAKEAVLLPKDGVRAVPFRTEAPSQARNLEVKISKMVERPWDSAKIKQILLSHSKKPSIKESQQLSKFHFLQKAQELNEQSPSKRHQKQRKRMGTEGSILSQAHQVQPPQEVKQLATQGLTQKVAKKASFNSTNESPDRKDPQAMALPQKVSAAAYIIYELTEKSKVLTRTRQAEQEGWRRGNFLGRVHAAFNIKTSCEIASLTKIMTCIIVIETCEKAGIDPRTEKYRVGQFESSIRGTTADIEVGQIYSIHQLLLGLMLPSGNDASLALSRWAGNVLLVTDPVPDRRKPKGRNQSAPQEWAAANRYLRRREQRLKPRRCYNRFLAEMNKKARLLGLERTTYVNSHGLSNPHNKSCCLDLAILCEYALQNSYFCQIVSTKELQITIEKWTPVASPTNTSKKQLSSKRNNVGVSQDPEEMNLEEDLQGDPASNRSQSEDEDSDVSETGAYTAYHPNQKELPTQEKKAQVTLKDVKWTNTHRLLHQKEEYRGIKTGVTATAGACLASYIRIAEREFVVVVLNSKKLSLRFADTQILREWVQKKEKIGKFSEATRKEGTA